MTNIIKVTMGELFGGFDDAEVVELKTTNENEEDVLNKGKLNDYKQNQVKV